MVKLCWTGSNEASKCTSMGYEAMQPTDPKKRIATGLWRTDITLQI